MNMLKRLLVTALALSASHVSAFTNKNFNSSPRPQNASLLLDSHVMRDLTMTKGKDLSHDGDRFGGNFMVSGYYSESNKAADLGKYFGIKDKAKFDANIGNNLTADEFDLGAIIHNGALVAAPKAHPVSIELAPKTISYGVEFAYVQCLSKILEGLHLSISLPVERVENNMNLKVTGAAADVTQVTTFLDGSFSTGTAAALGNAFGDAHGGQSALKNALIKGKQTATGIADIEAMLGYDFVRNDGWTAGLNIGVSIPTGNSVTGKYVFEPLYGNGGHWELGFGGKVCGRLWHDGDQRIGLHLSADYRYGFQANETRTLGINDIDWGQYALAGVVGARQSAGEPSANGLTQALSVTPNSALRGNLGLEYGNGGFLFGVHYAPAWRQAESVTGGKVVATSGLVPAAFALGNVAHVFGVDANLAAADNRGIVTLATDANLSRAQATRESQLSHRLGGDLGYTFKEWEYPVALGVGAHYEFNKDNASIQNWGVNIKAGIGF